MSKKNIVPIIIISLILQSCYTGKVYHINDEFTNENKVKLTQSTWFYAADNSLFNSHKIYVFLKWINQKDKDLELTLFFNTGIQSEVKDDFYIKINDKKYHLYFKNIDEREIADQVSNQHIENVYEEEDSTKDTSSDDKDKNKKRILKTIVDNNSYTNHYKKIKAIVLLDKAIKQQLKNANEVKMQFYINETPFKKSFNKLEKAKIRKLFL